MGVAYRGVAGGVFAAIVPVLVPHVATTFSASLVVWAVIEAVHAVLLVAVDQGGHDRVHVLDLPLVPASVKNMMKFIIYEYVFIERPEAAVLDLVGPLQLHGRLGPLLPLALPAFQPGSRRGRPMNFGQLYCFLITLYCLSSHPSND